jgi:hypothetical protein
MNAPTIIANPPSNSTRTVAHDNQTGAGIPSACNILAKSSDKRYVHRTSRTSRKD